MFSRLKSRGMEWLPQNSSASAAQESQSQYNAPHASARRLPFQRCVRPGVHSMKAFSLAVFALTILYLGSNLVAGLGAEPLSAISETRVQNLIFLACAIGIAVLLAVDHPLGSYAVVAFGIVFLACWWMRNGILTSGAGAWPMAYFHWVTLPRIEWERGDYAKAIRIAAGYWLLIPALHLCVVAWLVVMVRNSRRRQAPG